VGRGKDEHTHLAYNSHPLHPSHVIDFLLESLLSTRLIERTCGSRANLCLTRIVSHLLYFGVVAELVAD
jgi:hypothetical protein